MRPVRLFAVPVLSVLLLSACGDGPIQTGAAATVGGDRIETEQLQAVVERGLADPQAAQQLGADREAYQRQVLSRLITGELLREAAEERGISVTAGEVDARIAEFSAQLGGREQLEAQAAQSGIAAPDLRPFLRDLTLNDKLADELVEDEVVPQDELQALYQQGIAQYDLVVARHILVGTQAEAQQVLAQVRAEPARFGEIAAARSLDEGSKARGGELDPAGRGTFVTEFEEALFGAEEGEYGIVQTQFGFHVFNLLERRTTPFAEARPMLRRQALVAERMAALDDVLRETAADAGVRVNPRFGTWDGESVQVVERDSRLSTPAPEGGAGGLDGAPILPPAEPGAPGPGAPQEQAPQEQVPQEQAPAPTQ